MVDCDVAISRVLLNTLIIQGLLILEMHCEFFATMKVRYYNADSTSIHEAVVVVCRVVGVMMLAYSLPMPPRRVIA